MFRVNPKIQDDFFQACQDGDVAEYERLRSEGADPNYVDRFTKQRAIHVAVSNCQLEIVRRLVSDKSVLIDVADGAWRFPIDISEKFQAVEMTKLLATRLDGVKAEDLNLHHG